MTMWIIIIALLLIAAALGWVLERKFDEAGRLGRELERMKAISQRWEDRAVENERGEAKAEDALAESHAKLQAVTEERDGFMQQLAETRRKAAPRPARLRIEGGMTPEQVQAALAGHRDVPAIKAVLDHVSHLVVQAADLATDEPRDPVREPDRLIQGFNAEQRTHAAGRACALAELLADLQRLTAAKEEREAA